MALIDTSPSSSFSSSLACALSAILCLTNLHKIARRDRSALAMVPVSFVTQQIMLARVKLPIFKLIGLWLCFFYLELTIAQLDKWGKMQIIFLTNWRRLNMTTLRSLVNIITEEWYLVAQNSCIVVFTKPIRRTKITLYGMSNQLQKISYNKKMKMSAPARSMLLYIFCWWWWRQSWILNVTLSREWISNLSLQDEE